MIEGSSWFQVMGMIAPAGSWVFRVWDCRESYICPGLPVYFVVMCGGLAVNLELRLGMSQRYQ